MRSGLHGGPLGASRFDWLTHCSSWPFTGAMGANCHTCYGRETTSEKWANALPRTAAVGGAIYVLCAPVVHVLRERPLAGLASFGVRAGLPLLATLGTYGVDEAFRTGREHSVQGVLFGLAAIPFAFALAMTTDYVLLTPGPGGLSLAW